MVILNVYFQCGFCFSYCRIYRPIKFILFKFKYNNDVATGTVANKYSLTRRLNPNATEKAAPHRNNMQRSHNHICSTNVFTLTWILELFVRQIFIRIHINDDGIQSSLSHGSRVHNRDMTYFFFVSCYTRNVFVLPCLHTASCRFEARKHWRRIREGSHTNYLPSCLLTASNHNDASRFTIHTHSHSRRRTHRVRNEREHKIINKTSSGHIAYKRTAATYAEWYTQKREKKRDKRENTNINRINNTHARE